MIAIRHGHEHSLFFVLTDRNNSLLGFNDYFAIDPFDESKRRSAEMRASRKLGVPDAFQPW